jgi:hypothetical protein
MGYRSEVGFACTDEVNNLLKAVAETDAEFKKFLGEGDGSHDSRYIWQDIKYYDGYAPVDCLNNIMDFLGLTGLDEEYGFLRIGEELEDIEQKGAPYEFHMHVNRNIEI